jgi:hypothetical protein
VQVSSDAQLYNKAYRRSLTPHSLLSALRNFFRPEQSGGWGVVQQMLARLRGLLAWHWFEVQDVLVFRASVCQHPQG